MVVRNTCSNGPKCPAAVVVIVVSSSSSSSSSSPVCTCESGHEPVGRGGEDA